MLRARALGGPATRHGHAATRRVGAASEVRIARAPASVAIPPTRKVKGRSSPGRLTRAGAI